MPPSPSMEVSIPRLLAYSRSWYALGAAVHSIHPWGPLCTSQPRSDPGTQLRPAQLPPGPASPLLQHPSGCTDTLLSQRWREGVHYPRLQVRKPWCTCTMSHGHSTRLRPAPPAPWGPQRHHGPKLPHLLWAHSAANLGRTPCGVGLCAIPGGPCSIRTRVGMLCSTAADGGCCTGLSYSREGGMGSPPQEGSIRLHPDSRGTCWENTGNKCPCCSKDDT